MAVGKKISGEPASKAHKHKPTSVGFLFLDFTQLWGSLVYVSYISLDAMREFHEKWRCF
jgi:hypothetical protein